jgi:ABC-type dipeptide/oligopeptide/nickel transport system permease component
VSGLLRGDLGYSFEYDRPVSAIIGEHLAMTMVISIADILFTWMVALPIGVYSATHKYSWADHGLTFLAFLGLATPDFLLALVLMFVSFFWFGLSVGGLFSPEMQTAPWSWAKVLDLLRHLWVPVLVIGASGTAGMIRRLRANLLDELKKPYVTTAPLEGLTAQTIESGGGLLFTNKAMLRENVLRLATDEGLRWELGSRLCRYLTEVVSWEVIAGQYFEADRAANAEGHAGVPIDIPPEF